MRVPLIIGVAGGSGSGKTTFARRLMDSLGGELCVVLGQDSYYIDQSSKFDHDGGSVNFDHPDALEFSLMAKHLVEVKKGNKIKIPNYDFATHTRSSAFEELQTRPIILVDGILIFSQPDVVEQLDHCVFIDCPEKMRFERRLRRDVNERGRTPEGVEAQFLTQVKPMHDKFVEPSKAVADFIVNIDNFDVKVSEMEKLCHDYLKI